MTTTLSVPRADAAERAVAGGLLVYGLTLADPGLKSDDFYRPELARVAVAAAELTDLPRFCAGLDPFPTPADLPADLVALAYDLPTRHGVVAAAAAFLAEESAVWVASLMDDAPSRSQLAAMAARVADAARRRRLMATCADVYRSLGEGVGLEEARELLESAA